MKRIFIDVREPSEFESGHVAGAINIPLSKLSEGTLSEIPKDDELVVYCRSGGRASVAMGILVKMGYSDVVNGINATTVNATYKL